MALTCHHPGGPILCPSFPISIFIILGKQNRGLGEEKKIHTTLLKKLRNVKTFSSCGMNIDVYYRGPQSFSKTLGAGCVLEFRFWDSGKVIKYTIDFMISPAGSGSTPYSQIHSCFCSKTYMTSHTKREK